MGALSKMREYMNVVAVSCGAEKALFEVPDGVFLSNGDMVVATDAFHGRKVVCQCISDTLMVEKRVAQMMASVGSENYTELRRLDGYVVPLTYKEEEGDI